MYLTLTLSNNFILYGSVENSLWIAAIWRQEDALTVNICRTICAHDHCSSTFIILTGLWDVNETRFWSKYQPITAECNTSETFWMLVFYQVWEFLRFALEFLNRIKYCCSFFQPYSFFLGRTKIIISWWAFGSQPSAVIAHVLNKNTVSWQTRNKLDYKLPKLKLSQNAKNLQCLLKFGLVEDNVTVFQWPWNSASG